MLESTGIKVVLKPNIHQKFAVVDQKIIILPEIRATG